LRPSFETHRLRDAPQDEVGNLVTQGKYESTGLIGLNHFVSIKI